MSYGTFCMTVKEQCDIDLQVFQFQSTSSPANVVFGLWLKNQKKDCHGYFNQTVFMCCW